MNHAYLLTGGNEGDRAFHLKQARAKIEEICGETTASALYETAPWGKTDQAPFLNQALSLSTNLPAPELMLQLLGIEKSMGRRRAERYGSRTIDIDIIFFNDEIYDLPALKIPHPELQNRRFVLEPMNEIAPELLHPVFRKTIRQLLTECKDVLAVKKI